MIGSQPRHSGRHDYFNFKVPLGHWPSKLVEEGDYSFPFIFALPSNLPGSLAFKHHSAVAAEISYKLMASFEGIDVYDEFSLLVIQPNIEALKPDLQTLTRPVRHFSCINRGIVRISARFIDRLLEPGGFAKVLVEVDNKQSDCAITHINCNLWRKLSIMSNKGERYEVRDQMSSVRLEGVPPRGSLLNSKEFEVKLCTCEDDPSLQMSSTEGQMINCTYYLEVAAYFQRWMCINVPALVLMSLVALSPKPPDRRNLPEIPDLWNPRIMPVANLGNSSRGLLSLSFTDN